MHRSFLGAATMILAIHPGASFGQISANNLAAEKRLVHVRQYFADLGAFAIFQNRGERAADTYMRPKYDVQPKREKCFPQYGGGPIRGQPVPNLTYSTEMDVSGLLSAGVSESIKAELKAKVNFSYETSTQVREIKTEEADANVFLHGLDAVGCPELQPALKQALGDGKYLVIQTIYHLEGELIQSFTLRVTGSLSGAAQTTLLGFLARLKLPLPEMKLEGTGEYKNLGRTAYTYKIDMPAAFQPWHLNRRHLDDMYKNYLRDGIGGYLKKSLQKEVQVRELFQKYPQLEKASQDPFGFFSEGELVPFDKGDKRHVEYVGFVADLNVARAMMRTLQ